MQQRTLQMKTFSLEEKINIAAVGIGLFAVIFSLPLWLNALIAAFLIYHLLINLKVKDLLQDRFNKVK